MFLTLSLIACVQEQTYQGEQRFGWDDFETFRRIKSLHLEKEGPDGIGRLAYGYYVEDWNTIYIPDMNIAQISVVDSSGHKKQSYVVNNMTKDYPLIVCCASSKSSSW